MNPSERARAMGLANKRHGMTRKTEYNIWLSMRARCNNPKANNYHLYGGRGITVCERWASSFDAFYADMGPRPEGMSLDRKEGSLGYSPENCRWATASEQGRNKRTNRIVTINGESQCVAAWLERFGLPVQTYYSRRRLGWSEHDALTLPPDLSRPRRRKAAALTNEVEA